jgi:hypothetical protein
MHWGKKKPGRRKFGGEVARSDGRSGRWSRTRRTIGHNVGGSGRLVSTIEHNLNQEMPMVSARSKSNITRTRLNPNTPRLEMWARNTN